MDRPQIVEQIKINFTALVTKLADGTIAEEARAMSREDLEAAYVHLMEQYLSVCTSAMGGLI